MPTATTEPVTTRTRTRKATTCDVMVVRPAKKDVGEPETFYPAHESAMGLVDQAAAEKWLREHAAERNEYAIVRVLRRVKIAKETKVTTKLV